jgi:hypothetical protein
LGPTFALRLSDALREYIALDELVRLCVSLDVPVDEADLQRNEYGAFSSNLTRDVELGNNRILLEALLDTLALRASRGVARNNWERQDYHRGMVVAIEEMRGSLGEPKIPSQISTPAASRFTAKSMLREFLSPAETEVLLVDNWVGPETLDCLRDVKHPIRILTGDRQDLEANGFDRTLGDTRIEGYRITIRRHPSLHDRYLVFNDRCWLVGSSLKDAGKKELNVIELIDGKSAIRRDLEDKWTSAQEHKP